MTAVRLSSESVKSASECKDELSILNKKISVPKLPFTRIKYNEAIKKLQDKKVLAQQIS